MESEIEMVIELERHYEGQLYDANVEIRNLKNQIRFLEEKLEQINSDFADVLSKLEMNKKELESS